MKRFLLIAIAALSLTACGRNEAPGFEEPTPSSFLPDQSETLGWPLDIEPAVNYFEHPESYTEHHEFVKAGPTRDGYMTFDYDCSLVSTEGVRLAIQCEDSMGLVYSDDQLNTTLPLVLNVDVLRPDWACTSICLDANRELVGAVQMPMYEWRANHCIHDRDDFSWTCKE